MPIMEIPPGKRFEICRVRGCGVPASQVFEDSGVRVFTCGTHSVRDMFTQGQEVFIESDYIPGSEPRLVVKE